MLPTVMGAFALLATVTVCAADDEPTFVLGNVRVAGEMVGSAGATPVPLRAAVTTGVGSDVVMLRAPLRTPEAAGVKTTLAVQEEPALRVAGQLCVTA